LADPEVRAGPDVGKFIEAYLIQGDRFRGKYPRQEAIDRKLLNQIQLNALTDRHRLLRVVQYQDTARIELIHDRLVEVACKFREERVAKENLAELERVAIKRLAEQQREAAARAHGVRLKRKVGAIAVFALVAAVIGVVAGYWRYEAQKWEQAAQINRAKSIALHAGDALDYEGPARAILLAMQAQ
jgi:hypothetical protein